MKRFTKNSDSYVKANDNYDEKEYNHSELKNSLNAVIWDAISDAIENLTDAELTDWGSKQIFYYSHHRLSPKDFPEIHINLSNRKFWEDADVHKAMDDLSDSLASYIVDSILDD